MKRQKKITLTFDESDWKNARWVVHGFQAGIASTYSLNAPRFIEAECLAKELHAQLRAQVGKEYDDVLDDIRKEIEEAKFDKEPEERRDASSPRG